MKVKGKNSYRQKQNNKSGNKDSIYLLNKPKCSFVESNKIRQSSTVPIKEKKNTQNVMSEEQHKTLEKVISKK